MRIPPKIFYGTLDKSCLQDYTVARFVHEKTSIPFSKSKKSPRRPTVYIIFDK